VDARDKRGHDEPLFVIAGLDPAIHAASFPGRSEAKARLRASLTRYGEAE